MSQLDRAVFGGTVHNPALPRPAQHRFGIQAMLRVATDRIGNGGAGLRAPAVPGILQSAAPVAPTAAPSLTAALASPPGAHAPSQLRRTYFRRQVLADTAVVLGTVALGSVLPGSQLSGSALLPAIAIAAVWLGLLSVFRTRDRRATALGAAEYVRVLKAGAASFGLLASVFLLIGFQQGAIALAATIPAGTVLLAVERWGLRRWLDAHRRAGRHLSRVVVVGKPVEAAYAVDRLRRHGGSAYQVVGIVPDVDPAAVELAGGDPAVWDLPGVPVVGTADDVGAAVRATSAEAVLVAGHLEGNGRSLKELAWELEQYGAELVLGLAPTHVAGSRLSLRPLDGLPLMHVDPPRFTGAKHVVKRSFDVVASALALVVLAPVFALLAILIKRDSPGPVIFRQERVCRNGGTFSILKFRSMVLTAEEELARLREANEGNDVLFKLRDDPRVTRTGKWMRRFSLDELPQIVNVLRGEMSLVGPRPPLPGEVAQYSGPEGRRLFIKPGLTGLWQVSGRSNLSWEESIRLDLYYVENWSPLGDLHIIWRTVQVLLRPVGAY